MAKPNYAFQKRQRELAKKQKKEAKEQKRAAAHSQPTEQDQDRTAPPPVEGGEK